MAEYCLPLDVLAKVDPTFTDAEEDFDYNTSYDEVVELIREDVVDASSEFDERTRNPHRLTREYHQYHDANVKGGMGLAKVWLDHRNVLPFDPDEGDSIEVRVGRTEWRDLTAETNLWELNERKGILRLFIRSRGTVKRRWWAVEDNGVRVTYRHGAWGHNRTAAAQSELSEAAQTDDSDIAVEHPDRFVGGTRTVLVGDEYMSVRAAPGDDRLTVESRGRRRTTESGHDAGEAVHYCPETIRSAVAARAAHKSTVVDNELDVRTDSSDSPRPSDKMEEWQREWETALGKYTEATSL